MKIFIYITAGIIIGFVVSRFFSSRKRDEVLEVGKMALADINKERHVNKEQGKQKIMNLLEKKETITNNDVEELIGVSDSTVTRYFEELEEEGKIEQVGERGGTYYQKV